MTNIQGDARFLTTRWSLVLRAGQSSEEGNAASDCDTRQALEDLCRIYWFPLYAFARRQSMAPQDAQDLVQAFFLDLLERSSLSVANPQRGRFRNFLLTSFRNFSSKQRERNATLKRGGRQSIVSFENTHAEQRFGLNAQSTASPEQQFLRDWTMELLDSALLELRNSYIGRGQRELLDALQDYLAETIPPPYEQLASELGHSVGAIRVALHRMRSRYRNAVREAIGNTLAVSEEDEIEAELTDLMHALSSPTL